MSLPLPLALAAESEPEPFSSLDPSVYVLLAPSDSSVCSPYNRTSNPVLYGCTSSRVSPALCQNISEILGDYED